MLINLISRLLTCIDEEIQHLLLTLNSVEERITEEEDLSYRETDGRDSTLLP